MNEKNKPLVDIVDDLKERAKELNCLYAVQEILQDFDASVEDICDRLIKAIPHGWQYPDVCQACITLRHTKYQSEGFIETEWSQCTEIIVRDEVVGKICVLYIEERPIADEGPFLKEERKLIDTIAELFGLFLLHKQLKAIFEGQDLKDEEQKTEWLVIIDLLRRTDPNLLIRVSRRMVNYLFWNGIKEAEELMNHFSPSYKRGINPLEEINKPFQKQISADILSISNDIFKVAGKHLKKEQTLELIQNWIKEDRSNFLVNTLENSGSTLLQISGAIEKYYHLSPLGLELSKPRERSLRVSLTRRLLNDKSSFVRIAGKVIEVKDFNDLIKRIIFPVGSHGKLGGKSSGLFLAMQILKKATANKEILGEVKYPKTWYITSDGIFNLMNYNDLSDVIEQKYKNIDQVRQEYPYIIQLFKNSLFDPEIIKGLSVALDDLGEVPVIVRSSSLLEDQVGASFAGKYKSLFLANQGSKEERLIALMDAIAEVYASTFGPDPVEYRAQHGLLDYHEEMGIMIQEVVGKKVGKYLLPAFAGVAFSQNEFRWSSRIKREDGLIRVVPGLGTRAVDRLSDDYPILIAPGQPRLRVNVTQDEVIRYSPRHIDVMNLETRSFETIEIDNLLKQYGKEYPQISKLVSVLKDDILKKPRALGIDFEKDQFVVTMEGLITDTHFVKQVSTILSELQDKYGNPVDIEFAHDGENLYLLQCRTQSFVGDSKPAEIPEDIPDEKIIFSANRFISNGVVSNITLIVYVDPQKYSEIESHEELLAVGKAIGKLNSILPQRQFILMGPGRWGSRGDIKLGVSITYSDINNTSMLIEIARRKKGYVPDLSFGTHFFQDLVEGNIRYLPLYPDDEGIIFNEDFLDKSKNVLPDVFPEAKELSDVIKIINVPDSTNGEVLNVLMNADMEEAVAILANQDQYSSK
ncbi:MAG: PEP/pyruvate-binding domain-containing protein [Ignavibacterium sp.]|nr:MAG: PEP/pyruvate-binding domain-containing protein [Ignavibacterium sp.]